MFFLMHTFTLNRNSTYYGLICIVNAWCKNVLEVLFFDTSKPWDHLNQKIAQCNSTKLQVHL